jgi:tetratricopeptide (TPR) repeat protein
MLGETAQRGLMPAREQLAAAAQLLERQPELAVDAVEALIGTSDDAEARRIVSRAYWILAGRHAAAGDHQRAVAHFRATAALATDTPTVWIGLGDALRAAGAADEAESAYLRSVAVAANEPALAEAARALNAGDFARSEQLLRDRLRDLPTDIAAIRLLGELAARLGRNQDAIALLGRALQLAPGFAAARELLARILGQSHPAKALDALAPLVAQDPTNPSLALYKASLLVRIGDQAQAKAIYDALLAADDRQPKIWMSLGHVLKTLGRQPEAIEAYRRALALQPNLGEAWWSLANLKTVRFGDEDMRAMRQALAATDEAEDQLHLHFALGKALEDAGRFERAFAAYRDGNHLRRQQLPYSADETQELCARTARVVTPALLEARRGQGSPAPDPIFIVGLPRSGSTLVEQILASHSQIEGTMELPDLMSIAARMKSRANGAYPQALAELAPNELRALGEEYLERTRVTRRSDRPLFIDKMPNNWQHVGLIQLILPNARIIDARRHPVGCCFSGWKQHFARGQAFSYELRDIGRYYRDYVALMRAFDEAMPGRVHRVIYERMVADTEAEVRRMLAYLDLPFEESCLAYWRNSRAVRTASSEQVRQPIFTDGLDHWRKFEPWLLPLLEELQPVLETYAD